MMCGSGQHGYTCIYCLGLSCQGVFLTVSAMWEKTTCIPPSSSRFSADSVLCRFALMLPRFHCQNSQPIVGNYQHLT